MNTIFTPEELAEIKAADAEIEYSFQLTLEEYAASRERDKQASAKCVNRRDYYRRNAEKERARRRAYYATHKDKEKQYRDTHKEQSRVYRLLHSEEIKDYKRAYREANREKIREYQRKYYLRRKGENSA